MKKSNRPIYEKLTAMPLLDHWPHRPGHFSYDASKVIDYIAQFTENRRHAVSVFNQAKKIGVILFDSNTRKWHGNEDWE